MLSVRLGVRLGVLHRPAPQGLGRSRSASACKNGSKRSPSAFRAKPEAAAQLGVERAAPRGMGAGSGWSEVGATPPGDRDLRCLEKAPTGTAPPTPGIEKGGLQPQNPNFHKCLLSEFSVLGLGWV